MRIGQGFDAHRFAPAGTKRELWLACLRWQEDERRGCEGVLGDSDGDVAAHAVIDAVLSACGLGDIGVLFGVGSRSRGAGMHGDAMLGAVGDHVREHGWVIMNVSVSIVGNAPRIGRRRDEARHAMSSALGAPVSITATTTDGMGFTGRGEGIAAIATALVVRG
ncbi:2-C-methyl-D-erythritol 2,4-cyclodiphosphate synthase [Bifidobacterium sp. SMB2]|uniref:2-C-methyl-D-erythritol 2,4-cyclodiphosphate synthase n=1 Tax=Bifidobacterium saimiriisciurei TaxID=2661627 RepID=A0ABX0C953_9BIFI|nr:MULTISPECIES: 2-C-methyl-D-erythritol 2,4-cyclodiphosphate synthase [Bifidobacterium]NEG96131.1 2-C-methyl-D-erythritol 2,4-cyclodiphosphate synthase [Bifidobacterium sp. SMB2]NEH10791.1 2-C-methyl-D-erythritol 2,4-cyclodiphosphate synthase [Bifidobacterium saimiriisciurei]